MSDEGSPGRRWQAYVLLASCALFWSGNVVIARALHEDVPPLALSFWRWCLAAVLVLPFAARELYARRAAIMRSWPTLIAGGVSGMAAYSGMVYTGLQATTATNSALINATIPVLVSALSACVGVQRLAIRQWAGVGLSLAGVLVVILGGAPGGIAHLRTSTGDWWVLAGVASFVVFTVCLGRGASGLSPFAYLSAIITVAALVTLPLYLWELARGAAVRVSAYAMGGIGYVVVFPSVLAYLFWNRGVEAIGPARAGMFFYLMPVFTTVLAIAFLGEQLAAHHAGGSLLIVVGIWLTTFAAGRASVKV